MTTGVRCKYCVDNQPYQPNACLNVPVWSRVVWLLIERRTSNTASERRERQPCARGAMPAGNRLCCRKLVDTPVNFEYALLFAHVCHAVLGDFLSTRHSSNSSTVPTFSVCAFWSHLHCCRSSQDYPLDAYGLLRDHGLPASMS